MRTDSEALSMDEKSIRPFGKPLLQLEQDRTGMDAPLSTYYRAAGRIFHAPKVMKGARRRFSLIPAAADNVQGGLCKWESADYRRISRRSCIPFSI